MPEKKKVLIRLLTFLILTLPTIFTVRVYIHQSKFEGDKYRILFLYHNTSSLEGTLKYNTKCNAGLEFAIEHQLERLGLNYEIIRFETCKSCMNKTFLDSFDLVVVGGIYYWWKFSSSKDRVALFQTLTPIIASVHYGTGINASLLNTITGVWSEKIEILPRNATVVYFTNNSQKTIKETQYFFDRRAYNFWLINTNVTDSAKVFAYGIREKKKFPLLIFNGTKNFLINTFTYKGSEDYYDLWEWPKLLLVSLDYLFDLLPDEILRLKIYPRSEPIILRVTNNLWLTVNQNLIIPSYMVAVFFVFLIYHQAIDIEYSKKSKLRIKIHMKSFRKAIFRMQQISLILLIISFYMYSFTPNIIPLQEALQQIVIAVLILTLVLYIMDSRLSKIDYTANGPKKDMQ